MSASCVASCRQPSRTHTSFAGQQRIIMRVVDKSGPRASDHTPQLSRRTRFHFAATYDGLLMTDTSFAGIRAC